MRANPQYVLPYLYDPHKCTVMFLTRSDFQAWFFVYSASTSSGSSLDRRIRGSRSALVLSQTHKGKSVKAAQHKKNDCTIKETGPTWNLWRTLWTPSSSKATERQTYQHINLKHKYGKTGSNTLQQQTYTFRPCLWLYFFRSSLMRSHLPNPVGYMGHTAGPPSQKVHAGYMMSW